MQRLKGFAGGGGAAIGTATVLHPPIGIPMVPARLMAEMQRRSRDMEFEPIDIVLVAQHYRLAAGVTVPWGRVVGIVCQQEERGLSADVPTVTGIPNLVTVVGDDTLLLVDGDRGFVLVDPDSASIAAFQAERERISPRRRLFLDFEHQTATTADGRQILVAAGVNGLTDAAVALDKGADMLYLKGDSGFLAPGQTDGEQTDLLLQLGRSAAGKPIVVAADLESVSAAALLRASLRAEFTLSLSAASGARGFEEARNLLESQRMELIEEEAEFGDVRLAAGLRAGEELPDDLSDYLIGRLFLVGADPAGRHNDLDWIDDVVSEASGLLVPVLAECGPNVSGSLPLLIGIGAAGVIVPAKAVQDAKETIRELDYSACRAQLRA